MKKRMKYSVALYIFITICFMASPAAAQLADTPWSMFHHDLNHTGLSPHYGPDTPTVKWTLSTGDKIFGSAVIGDDGTVYIGTRGRQSTVTGSKLYAIYPNGTERWHWIPGHFIDSTPAIAHDGTLYVGCWDKSLYAIHPNGTEKWEFSDSNGGFVYTSPAIATDGTLYTGNNNGKIYAIHPNGTEKWNYSTGCAIQSSPAIDADGTIYVGSNDKKFYAFYPDGTLKWLYTTGNRVMSSPAIGTDGTIYVGSDDKKLYAFYPSGTLKWTYATADWVRSSPAIDADGTIHVGSGDKKLYAFYPNGTLKWSYTAGGRIRSSPAIDADGTIYVGSKDGYVYAVNPNGTLLWKCNTGMRIYAPSPAIASDGTIYIGNEDGDFYAIGPGIGPGIPPNNPPVLDPVGDRIINETETLIIALNASDPDGDVLTYSCNRTDLFVDFNPATGTGNWITDYNDARIYWVDFGVSDCYGDTTNETIRIEVINVNRPPILDPIGDKIINENETLIIALNASDPDLDVLTYSVSNLPDGAVFNSTTGTLSWTPTFEQAGTYTDVHCEVTDNELVEWENITIIVINVPPMISVVSKSEVMFQEQFTVNITVDPRMTEIYGTEYDISFDNSVLHAEWQNEGTFLNQDGADTTVYLNTIDNDAGKVSFAATRIDTPDGVSDPATLATIKFTAIKQGACTNMNITRVIASDPDAQPIPQVDINNSSVCVSSNMIPVAVGRSMYKYNNNGQRYICKVYFNGTESSDSDGAVIYWRWSFGDGNYGTGELKDHVYQSWNWNGSGYDPFTATLTVTDDGDPHELDNTTPFEVIVYTAGDANGDGEVDILDATIVGLEWDEEANFNGDLYWHDNPRGDMADLNNDGIVDILDAVIIGTCWGHAAW
jgi:outer membrane protein assembly factor BamB